MTRSFPDSLVVVSLDEQSIALDIAQVERIVPVVEIASLPGAPAGVRGVVNFQGRVIPVFDLRVRFGRAERELRMTDYLVIARAGPRLAALLVDGVVDVVKADATQVIAAGEILPELDVIEGVIKLDGDIILIHDLDRFLSTEHELVLAAAMSR